MVLVHLMNPQQLQYLLCLTKTRKDLSIAQEGTLWADENSPAGTLRCLNHMYGKKKAVRSSILHRFIIKGETWKLFKQVPTVLVPAQDGKEAHFFYAAYDPVKLNHEDILHQAFDRHGIIHQPPKIGTIAEVREKARVHNEYESAPPKSAEYAQLFEHDYNEVVQDSPNLQPRKRARVSTNIIPKSLDNDRSSSSDTF